MLFIYRNKCIYRNLLDIISSNILLRNKYKCNYISCSAVINAKKNCLFSINILTKIDIIFPVIISFEQSQRRRNLYSKAYYKKSNMDMDKYSIIGFDLDGTILRYNINQMVPLEYKVIAQYLVKEKEYSREILKPFNEDIDFIQKGLILDSVHGNILKLSPNGDILKATHGTKMMLTDDEIIKIYGPDKKWNISTQFINNPLSTWNGPLSEQIRALLDYFDMPSSLVMARAVDTINSKNTDSKKYHFYPDILEALIQMYKREHFAEGVSDYFEALKKEPNKYILKTKPLVIEGLKELKKTKATFLLTGSNIDFANLTATYALGPNWRDLFDVVVTFAKKPGFFTDNRPFYKVECNKETCEIDESEIKLGNTYSQGNWKALEKLLLTKFDGNCERTKHESVYVGDNLLQDVYTPNKYANIDTIAIVEELLNEEKYSNENVQAFPEITKSKFWGSYFRVEGEDTLWSDVIKNYSIMCVPTIDYIFKNQNEKKSFIK